MDAETAKQFDDTLAAVKAARESCERGEAGSVIELQKCLREHFAILTMEDADDTE